VTVPGTAAARDGETRGCRNDRQRRYAATRAASAPASGRRPVKQLGARCLAPYRPPRRKRAPAV